MSRNIGRAMYIIMDHMMKLVRLRLRNLDSVLPRWVHPLEQILLIGYFEVKSDKRDSCTSPKFRINNWM